MAQQAAQKAAAAMGGLDRIQALKNIRLIGYGQYGYMFGGGNITGDANAPMKFEAANNLERVWDLEHGRYQQLERRNYLFPFAIPAGHDYHLNDNRFDGEVPYDILPSGAAQRVYSWFEDAHAVDGVHMRRMWSIVNPIAAVRVALDPRQIQPRHRSRHEPSCLGALDESTAQSRSGRLHHALHRLHAARRFPAAARL
jgi:hypothetical protein